MSLLLRIAVRHCSKPSTFVIVWNGVGGLAGLSFQGGGGYLVAMYPLSPEGGLALKLGHRRGGCHLLTQNGPDHDADKKTSAGTGPGRPCNSQTFYNDTFKHRK